MLFFVLKNTCQFDTINLMIILCLRGLLFHLVNFRNDIEYSLDVFLNWTDALHAITSTFELNLSDSYRR